MLKNKIEYYFLIPQKTKTDFNCNSFLNWLKKEKGIKIIANNEFDSQYIYGQYLYINKILFCYTKFYSTIDISNDLENIYLVEKDKFEEISFNNEFEINPIFLNILIHSFMNIRKYKR